MKHKNWDPALARVRITTLMLLTCALSFLVLMIAEMKLSVAITNGHQMVLKRSYQADALNKAAEGTPASDQHACTSHQVRHTALKGWLRKRKLLQEASAARLC